MRKLAETERSFSARSVTDGMRQAFLEYFAPDGINFTPHPVNTRESLNSQPAPATRPPITLAWWPTFGDVSISGDLGYSTGPYQLTDTRENDKIVGQGFYFSIWKKQPDGSWRVAVDYGIETVAQSTGKETAKFQPSGWVDRRPKRIPASTTQAVLARDREFSARVAHGGTLKAYRNFTTWDKETRLYRDAMFPIIGQRNLQAFLKSHAEGNEWEPISGAVAASGELGYTYGKWTQPADRSQTGYYLRVWRFLSGRWLVVAEVMKHLPRQ